MRNYVVQSSDAQNTNPGYVAPFVLGAVASVIGATFYAQMKTGWREYCILWCAVIADSGSGKTPALTDATAPLAKKQWELDQRFFDAKKQYGVDKREYEADFSIWKSKRNSGKEGPQPEEPEEPHHTSLMFNDATVESIAAELSHNPYGALSLKDELSGWLEGFNAYRRGGGDEAFWLSSHSAQSARVTRKTGDLLVSLRRPAISVIGGIQPGIFRRIILENPSYLESGLAARFLFCSPPDESSHYSKKEITDAVKRRYEGLFESILESRGEILCDHPDGKAVELSQGAEAAFIGFYNTNADERSWMKSGAMKAALPKLTSSVARIALLFHVVNAIDSGNPITEITESEMKAAIRLVEWFKRETARMLETILGTTCEGIDFEAKAILGVIESNGGVITVRELQQKRRVYRPKGGAELAERKLREMVKKGILTTTFEQCEQGRGKEVFGIYSPGNGNTIAVKPEKNADCVTVTAVTTSENDFSEWSPGWNSTPENNTTNEVNNPADSPRPGCRRVTI